MEQKNNIESDGIRKLTLIERLKYFFINPSKLFEDYKIKPTWLIKTIIIAVLTIITAVITAKLTIGPQIDILMQQYPDMPKEQTEATIALMNSPLIIGFAVGGAIFAAAAAVFLGSLIYYGLIALFGGKTSYMKVVAVYSLAYVPYSIGALFKFAFAYYTNNFDSLLQPTLTDAIFGRLDLFVIWQVLLLVFGFAKVADLKLHKSAITVAIMWILGTGIAIILTFTNRLV